MVVHTLIPFTYMFITKKSNPANSVVNQAHVWLNEYRVCSRLPCEGGQLNMRVNVGIYGAGQDLVFSSIIKSLRKYSVFFIWFKIFITWPPIEETSTNLVWKRRLTHFHPIHLTTFFLAWPPSASTTRFRCFTKLATTDPTISSVTCPSAARMAFGKLKAPKHLKFENSKEFPN